jgi:streptogramin lyase
MIASILAVVPTATAVVCSRTYTVDADFDEGTLVGVEHDTVHDQLQLSNESVTLPFIWVPNSEEGTVSKVNTSDGRELGRYWTNNTANGNPSRTTVDLQGNCWLGNRGTGTVVKIGLYEAGQCNDTNGNGIIETSNDTNGDGNVTGSEILPWGKDECVLFEILLGNSGSGPRGLAIDANNDLWAGTFSIAGGNKFYHINGSTGTIIAADTININPYSSYGALIDGNGNIWSSCLNSYVLKIDPTTKAITKVDLNLTSYGLGIDNKSHLFVAGWGQNLVARIDVNPPHAVIYNPQNDSWCRGVAVTGDGDVWVVNSNNSDVTRLDNNLTWKATIDIGAGNWVVMSTGVAVDAAGKVWACNYHDGYLHRIDPATNSIDLSKLILGHMGFGVGKHYSYSDMTGSTLIGAPDNGMWTIVYDSGIGGANWSTVSWNFLEPGDSSITVTAASSNDGITFGPAESVTNGVDLTVADGRYLKVSVSFTRSSSDSDGDGTNDSPILYDLTVECNQPPNVTDAHPSMDCLWPPNHKFVDITIVGVTDPDGDSVTINITGITSDEPTASIDGAGGAKHAPDADGVGTDTASLRAERSGTGNGRVYEITFVASDGIADTVGNVTVCVPHDYRGKCVCGNIDDGQIYNATQINV